MSAFVEELIKDMQSNPGSFRDYNGEGVQKANVVICNHCNPPALSVICVIISGKDIPTTYIDRWRLTVAVKRWYKTVSLSTLQK